MNTVDSLSRILGERLLAHGYTVTTAESCTGGGIANAITAIAGCSQWFSHGFITYSNEAKQQLLNVPAEVIANHGAVSQEVVEAMARGAIRAANADMAVAVSGIAGPSGATPTKPVGTVWIAWQSVGQPPLSQCFYFKGDRKSVRDQAVIKSLEGLLQCLEKNTV